MQYDPNRERQTQQLEQMRREQQQRQDEQSRREMNDYLTERTSNMTPEEQRNFREDAGMEVLRTYAILIACAIVGFALWQTFVK